MNKNGSNFKVGKAVQIASGYTHGPNAAAFVLGPAGLAYDSANGNLYVNSEADDAVFAIPNALKAKHDGGKGTMIFQDNANLHGPLGLILASNGDLVLANSDGVNADPNHPSELVEITTGGQLVATKFIDPNNGGAFNVAESFADHQHRVAYVDDNTNMLSIWTIPQSPTIGGQALFDHNGSGTVSSHDQPLKGWTVYLDLNNDGTLDPGDPMAVTDAQGDFVITAPAPGTYTLREVVKKGFRITAPASGSFTVTATESQFTSGLVFLNAKANK